MKSITQKNSREFSRQLHRFGLYIRIDWDDISVCNHIWIRKSIHIRHCNISPPQYNPKQGITAYVCSIRQHNRSSFYHSSKLCRRRVRSSRCSQGCGSSRRSFLFGHGGSSYTCSTCCSSSGSCGLRSNSIRFFAIWGIISLGLRARMQRWGCCCVGKGAGVQTY